LLTQPHTLRFDRNRLAILRWTTYINDQSSVCLQIVKTLQNPPLATGLTGFEITRNLAMRGKNVTITETFAPPIYSKLNLRVDSGFITLFAALSARHGPENRFIRSAMPIVPSPELAIANAGFRTDIATQPEHEK
jgi:hypothetical protein